MIWKYHGVNLNLLIDFEDVKVVNPEGIEVDGKKYYTLIDKKYTVAKNTDKNIYKNNCKNNHTNINVNWFSVFYNLIISIAAQIPTPTCSHKNPPESHPGVLCNL